MNNMKTFLIATLLLISQQSFGMFFPASTWLCDRQGQESTPAPYTIRQISAENHLVPNIPTEDGHSMLNRTNIKTSERIASNQFKKEHQQQKRNHNQKIQEVQAKKQEEAKVVQAKSGIKKQRAALEQQIEIAERQADRFLLLKSTQNKKK